MEELQRVFTIIDEIAPSSLTSQQYKDLSDNLLLVSKQVNRKKIYDIRLALIENILLAWETEKDNGGNWEKLIDHPDVKKAFENFGTV
jgi:hypothetical protein